MNDLLNLVAQLMDYIDANSQNLNAATQQELALFLQEIWEFIQEQQTPILDPIPTLTPSAPSSNVNAFAYDDKNNKLMVQFLGDHPNPDGPIYEYDNVPPQVFELIQSGMIPAKTSGKNKWGKWWVGKQPSIGASVSEILSKGPFNYRKIT